ncbi:MATE family efflux transporter [Orenia marismortui]|uniref:Probable multidrug resistance protein NorM n=1 Tax=Orenia marismortui TaxID=46469 RepID=A0A4R8HB07_9FIRM|nr:MATE family efflux transporter [Orenia marismortui]TDX52879.1 putative MATE family efflux protein [Orenia marismortui]
MKSDDKFKYIIEGPVLSSIFKLSLPIMVSQFMQTLYNLADTLWVGRIGANAVAAISISFPIMFLMVSIGIGLTIAGTSLIAQYKGAANHKKVEQILGQLVSFIGSGSILIALFGVLFSEQLLIWMGAEQVILDDATAYLRIIFAGMPFMFGFFIFSSVLRGIGDTLTPSIMMFFSVVLNIILDPILIFGISIFPEMGLEGAAVATIFSRALVTIYAFIILIKGRKGLKLSFRDMVPDFEIIILIVKIGIPSSVEQSMVSIGQLLMTSLVASFGTMTLAAYGIVNRIISLPRILAFGLSAAATTMVGQNIGAAKKDRAEKVARVSLLTIFIVLSLVGIIIFIFPEQIIGVFNKQVDVLNFGSDYLRIVTMTFGFIGVMTVANGVFKGAGRTMQTMIISIVSFLLVRIPLAYLLSQYFRWKQLGLWWSVAISNISGALLALLLLKVIDWSEKVIDDQNDTNLMIDDDN